MDWKKAISIATAVFTLIATAGGAIWALDDKYVNKDQLAMVTGSVDLRFNMYRQDQIEDRIMEYKLYKAKNPHDETLDKDLSTLEIKQEKLEQTIQFQLQELQQLQNKE